MLVINKSPIDQYTLVHGAAGIAARHIGLSFQTTLALGFAWDFIVEPAAKKAWPHLFPHPTQDSPVHMAVDAVVPSLTWLLYDEYLKKNERR